MLKLTKKFEYGLLAIQYIAAMKPGEVATARQISEEIGIPYEFVAKVLQQLAKESLIDSVQGVRGGYKLNRPAANISLSQVAAAIEGPIQLIECEGNETPCDMLGTCTIKKPLTKIQKRFREIFDEATLEEIL
ncbi:MAG: Rrf2 family transcriptional regulator [Rhizobacter sp.]|nr:Rrf2 family transcriptional regulator [Chlorobiales bacterium]